ncbi:MAG: 23S rRNA (adenine(2503)-C(2))-methyltransferase RlmN [Phycisphaerae bacterium]|nr:23S rRNA (adenine(2503)-C(2))-methyltransferase RlmN [Phycisphaerae bacterium]
MQATPAEHVFPSPMGLTHEEFVRESVGRGLREGVALEVYKRFFREGPTQFPGLIPQPTRTLVTDSPEGDVTKFLLSVPARRDGEPSLETESVVIPMQRRHMNTKTLCVSSQVGCAMGCTFCETAQMGLIRSLSAAEIVRQWYAARHVLKHEIKNIVFMGMGEPLDNYDEVIRAIRVLTDHSGPSIGMGCITISTVGRIDGLLKLREQASQPGWKSLNLAVSINAPNDAIRDTIMPINRSMPLGELIPILESWPRRKSGAICVEYVLIPGVNSSVEHAAEIAERFRKVRCCVNVIPYNPRRDSPWPPPTEEEVWAFLRELEARGQFCKRRRTKGRDSMAACGQLGNEGIRKRKFVGVTVQSGPAARA